MIKSIVSDLQKHRRYFRKFRIFLIILIVISIILISLSYFIKIKYPQNNVNIYLTEEVIVNKPFDGKIYFNTDPNEMIFTKNILTAIDSAKESIEMAIYSINNSQIINALEEKTSKGIRVDFIIPKSLASENPDLFLDSKLNILFIDDLTQNYIRPELMHHKFLIIDADTDNRKIIFGNSNLTEYQERYDAGYIIETSDAEIITPFKNEFDLLWNKKNGIKKLRNSEYRIYSRKINYTDGFIELWFGPGFKKNSIKYRTLDLINSAQKNIDFVMWQFTDKELYGSMLKAANKGLKTRMLIDDEYIWADSSPIKKTILTNWPENLELSSDSFSKITLDKKSEIDENIPKDFNPYLHHHFMIIDDEILITGTNNWTFGGFYLNDEDMMITNIKSVLKSFKENFDLQFKINKGENINFEFVNNSIMVKDLFPAQSKIILYNENTYEDFWSNEICFEDSLVSGKIYQIPNECLEKINLIFIVDKDNNLLASEYLKK
jgi:phosphatidylserine/phosphatidylglycerophosphate/cardiolipin synthase-like enzyme